MAVIVSLISKLSKLSMPALPIPGGGRIGLGVLGHQLFHKYRAHSVSDAAASLGFYFVFSLFPFLFFLATLTAYLPFVKVSVSHLLNDAQAVLPRAAAVVMDRHVQALIGRPRPQLLTVGLIATLYSASRGVDALRAALNLAYDVKESRPLWLTEVIAFGVTVAGALLLLVGVTALIAGGTAGFWLAGRLHVGAIYVVAWRLARWPVTTLVIMSLGALCYYALPDVEQEFRFVTPGSIAATLATLLASWGLGLYATHVASYNVAYGAIGGVIVLMTWFYMSGLIYLLGGETNAILEYHSQCGKQEGARRPKETPPPQVERPSAVPVGAANSATVAEESRGGVAP